MPQFEINNERLIDSIIEYLIRKGDLPELDRNQKDMLKQRVLENMREAGIHLTLDKLLNPNEKVLNFLVRSVKASHAELQKHNYDPRQLQGARKSPIELIAMEMVGICALLDDQDISDSKLKTELTTRLKKIFTHLNAMNPQPKSPEEIDKAANNLAEKFTQDRDKKNNPEFENLSQMVALAIDMEIAARLEEQRRLEAAQEQKQQQKIQEDKEEMVEQSLSSGSSLTQGKEGIALSMIIGNFIGAIAQAGVQEGALTVTAKQAGIQLAPGQTGGPAMGATLAHSVAMQEPLTGLANQLKQELGPSSPFKMAPPAPPAGRN